MASRQRKNRPRSLQLVLFIFSLVLVTGGTTWPGVTPAGAAAPAAAAAGSTGYYVDSVNGNDGNAGTSPGSPWRSLDNVNNRSFGADDVINLARGSSWTGGGTSATLTINGGGAQGSPITVKDYGSGAAPTLRNPSSGNSVD